MRRRDYGPSNTEDSSAKCPRPHRYKMYASFCLCSSLHVLGFGGCLYWGNNEKQSYYVKNGWNIPGDIAYKDKEGYFWYVGRESDLIIAKSGGNVSAVEIVSKICL